MRLPFGRSKPYASKNDAVTIVSCLATSRRFLGILLLTMMMRPAVGQESLLVSSSDTSFGRVDFDVPIHLRLLWTDSAFRQIEPPQLRSLEASLKISQLRTSSPSLERFIESGKEGWLDVTDMASVRADTLGLGVILPRLKANRFYQFHFSAERPLTKEERSSATKDAVTGLDKFFRRGPGAQHDRNTFRTIQKELIRILLAATGDGFEVRQGSILDTTATYDDGLPLISALNTLHEYAANRDQLITNLKSLARVGVVDQVLISFEHMQETDSSTVARLHELYAHLKMQERSKDVEESPILDSLYAVSLAADRLIHLRSDEERRRLLNGEIALKPLDNPTSAFPTSTALDKIWTSKDFKERINSLNTTVQTLDALVSATRHAKHLIRLQTALPPVSLSNRDLDSLATHVEKTRDLVAGMKSHPAFSQFGMELGERDRTLAALAEQGIPSLTRESIYSLASSTASFETRATWYISADVGLLHAPSTELVSPYFGVNVYFVPVNKQARINSFPFLDSLPRRLAIMVGVTTQSVAEEGVREDLIGSRGLLVGVGGRITDAIRVSLGSMLFREVDPNPAITKSSVASSLFWSVSLDWDVGSTLGGLFDTIFK